MIEFTHNFTGYHNITLECSGHAGFAEAGHDVVCAAASALMAAAIEALGRYPDARLTVDARDGYCLIRCVYTPETAAVARVTVCGFEWLARQATGYVSCRRRTRAVNAERIAKRREALKNSDAPLHPDGGSV